MCYGKPFHIVIPLCSVNLNTACFVLHVALLSNSLTFFKLWGCKLQCFVVLWVSRTVYVDQTENNLCRSLKNIDLQVFPAAVIFYSLSPVHTSCEWDAMRILMSHDYFRSKCFAAVELLSIHCELIVTSTFVSHTHSQEV